MSFYERNYAPCTSNGRATHSRIDHTSSKLFACTRAFFSAAEFSKVFFAAPEHDRKRCIFSCSTCQSFVDIYLVELGPSTFDAVLDHELEHPLPKAVQDTDFSPWHLVPNHTFLPHPKFDLTPRCLNCVHLCERRLSEECTITRAISCTPRTNTSSLHSHLHLMGIPIDPMAW